MTKSSSQKQAEQKLNQSKRLEESFRQEQQGRQEGSLKTKAIGWSLIISMLPVLTVGTAIYYFNNQLTAKQISQSRHMGATGQAETKLAALHRQLSRLLIIETGVTAVLTGAIAAILSQRAIRPVLNAAAVSTTMVNRLRQESIDTIDTRTPTTSKNEVVVLETNLNLIKEKLPDLLSRQEADVERFQVLMKITQRIRESLNEQDVFRTTVEEVRKAYSLSKSRHKRMKPLLLWSLEQNRR
jgi:methyl-accepting chemotaxis protein PixJ